MSNKKINVPTPHGRIFEKIEPELVIGTSAKQVTSVYFKMKPAVLVTKTEAKQLDDLLTKIKQVTSYKYDGYYRTTTVKITKNGIQLSPLVNKHMEIL